MILRKEMLGWCYPAVLIAGVIYAGYVVETSMNRADRCAYLCENIEKIIRDGHKFVIIDVKAFNRDFGNICRWGCDEDHEECHTTCWNQWSNSTSETLAFGCDVGCQIGQFALQDGGYSGNGKK